MALEPDILLMDEPFAALDALTRRTMQQELLSLWDQLRFTVLFVTHSIEEAIIIGSRILVLSPHPGPRARGAQRRRPRSQQHRQAGIRRAVATHSRFAVRRHQHPHRGAWART